jgi:L-arabinose isomerase
VADHGRQIVEELSRSAGLPVRLVLQPVATTPESVLKLVNEANAAADCVGLICWMHTFSPGEMWTAGLRVLDRPLLHLHTQFHRDLPWAIIDPDYVNVHQSAQGDREFGRVCTRRGARRKVVVGHWTEPEVHRAMAAWLRAAAGWREMRGLKVARFASDAGQAAVTEGDKAAARLRLGVEVRSYALGDLAGWILDVGDAEVSRLSAEYDQRYAMADTLHARGSRRAAIRDAARTELGLRAFLDHYGCKALAGCPQDPDGLSPLRGIAVQRLMAQGYGFADDGDWQTAALCRAMKVMAAGLSGGASFMEDCAYHLDPSGGKGDRSTLPERPEGCSAQRGPVPLFPGQLVLGAGVLEICPSLAAETPCCEIRLLSTDGREEPVRLVFTAPPGPAVNVALVNLGERFRMLAGEVDAVAPPAPLPILPAARAVWSPRPDRKTAAAAWIYAGGPRYFVFSQALTSEHVEDFAEMAGVECLVIDAQTRLREFRDRLRWNAGGPSPFGIGLG